MDEWRCSIDTNLTDDVPFRKSSIAEVESRSLKRLDCRTKACLISEPLYFYLFKIQYLVV